MDGLLRTHQADTTARRLQLERTLAQRQSEVRHRTQEVEELTVKLSEAKKKATELEQELSKTMVDRRTVDSEQKRLIQEKVNRICILSIDLFSEGMIATLVLFIL